MRRKFPATDQIPSIKNRQKIFVIFKIDIKMREYIFCEKLKGKFADILIVRHILSLIGV